MTDLNRRRLVLSALGLLGVSAAGAACSARDTDLNSGKPHKSRFVCLGDSWTAGNQDGTGVSYPSLLSSAFPQAQFVNIGRAGWTSTEIAALWGVPIALDAFNVGPSSNDVTPLSLLGPTSTYRTESSIQFEWLGELRLPNGATLAGTLRHNATSTLWSDGWSFQTAESTGGVAAPKGSMFVCTEMDSHRGSELLLSLGRNNFREPDVVLRDCRAILERRDSQLPFSLLSVPTSVTEGFGTSNYARVRRLNEALRSEYPEEFVDVRAFMIDRGLPISGQTPDAEDLDSIAADTVPPALMVADGDHPNAAGYHAIAECLLDHLTKIGSVTGQAQSVAAIPGAVGAMLWQVDSSGYPLGSPVEALADRTDRVALRSPEGLSGPTLYRDSELVREYLSFDGYKNRMLADAGNDIGQPFTVVAKLRLRSIGGSAQGIVWTVGTPGATLSVTTTGRYVLNAGDSVQTPASVVPSGTPVTLVAVVDGANSCVGIAGLPLTGGDSGDRGLIAQMQVGYYFDTLARYAALDLFELRFYPWAFNEQQLSVIGAHIDQR